MTILPERRYLKMGQFFKFKIEKSEETKRYKRIVIERIFQNVSTFYTWIQEGLHIFPVKFNDVGFDI